MNIKISKKQNERLASATYSEVEFGSKMYETNTKNSDTDILRIYEKDLIFIRAGIMGRSLPNYHQFQYDDEENNTQYIYTDLVTFWKNQRSGDSTINSDIILFSDMFGNQTEKDRLKICRTYKVIKAYLGLAKRDIKKYKEKNRLFHAHRGLYTASYLMRNEMPLVSDLKDLIKDSSELIKEEIQSQIKLLNSMLDSSEIQMYDIPEVEDDLLQLLYDSNNIREFKY